MDNEITRLTVTVNHLESLQRIYWADLKDLISIYNRVLEPIGHQAQHVWVLDAVDFPTAHWTALYQYAQQPGLNPVVRRVAEYVAETACDLNNAAQELAELEQQAAC